MNNISCAINSKKTLPARLGLFFVFVLFAIVFAGCNKKSVAVSFAGNVDQVDAYIDAGNIKEANELLKKVAKTASGATEWFSVYKRYVRIGDVAEAGKIIKKAYTKQPNQPEVVAVYAHFLLTQNKLEAAEKIASRLEGTAYGSILTEIRLRLAGNDNDYLKREFVQTFRDAAYTTGDNSYLRNAAVIEAYNGFINEALQLHPHGALSDNDKIFWATISFDAGNFTQSYIDLSSVENTPEVLLLQADAAMYLNEQKAAYTLWKRVLDTAPDFSPIPYYNLSHYAYLNDLQVERGLTIVEMVSRFPAYMPGIAAYGNYAYDVNHRVPEDEITAAVRRAGFKSLRMEELDEMPVVPVEDALAKMDAIIEETNDPYMLVEKLKLQWKNSEKNNEEKLIDVWYNLEKNDKNDILNQYAVWLLSVLKRNEEANSVFNKYIKNKYGSNDYTDLVNSMSASECEYVAYLNAIDVPSDVNPDYEISSAMYKALVEKYTKSVPALMNYGAIFFANTDFINSLNMYKKAMELTTDVERKAEIQFRMARVYLSQRDLKSAQMCLSYCLQLNPDHANARLLYKQLDVDSLESL